MASSSRSKSDHRPSAEQRRMRIQQIAFNVLALLIILSMLVALVSTL